MDYKYAHENGFCHEWCKDNNKTLSEKVDKFFGKWPDEYGYLKFYHGTERTMEFSNNPHNSGWWTTVLTRKDYYKNKLDQIPWEQIA
jgi:hypothetical protein